MAKKTQEVSKSSISNKLGNMTEEYGSNYGAYLFLLGVVVALIVGVFASVDTVKANLPTILGVLAVLGLIVGLLNVTAQESDSFLIATIALLLTSISLVPALLLIVSITPQLSYFVDVVSGLLNALAVFVAPAAVVVSLRSIYHLASNR